jgi:hypothetical protein
MLCFLLLFILPIFPVVHCFNVIPSVMRTHTTLMYFDSEISYMHRSAFLNALDNWKATGYCDISVEGTLFGLKVAADGINTITYSNSTNIAASNHAASYDHNLRSWVIFDTDVVINKHNLVTYSASYDAFLHEIGHLLFLEHDGIPGSVMNSSIIVFPNGTSWNMSIWELHPDNVYGVYIINSTAKYCIDNSGAYLSDSGDSRMLSLSTDPIVVNV